MREVAVAVPLVALFKKFDLSELSTTKMWNKTRFHPPPEFSVHLSCDALAGKVYGFWVLLRYVVLQIPSCICNSSDASRTQKPIIMC